MIKNLGIKKGTLEIEGRDYYLEGDTVITKDGLHGFICKVKEVDGKNKFQICPFDDETKKSIINKDYFYDEENILGRLFWLYDIKTITSYKDLGLDREYSEFIYNLDYKIVNNLVYWCNHDNMFIEIKHEDYKEHKCYQAGINTSKIITETTFGHGDVGHKCYVKCIVCGNISKEFYNYEPFSMESLRSAQEDWNNNLNKNK